MFTFKDMVSRVSTSKTRYNATQHSWILIQCWWMYICRRLDWYDESKPENNLIYYQPDMGEW